jgi:hypothetical protein
MPQVLRPAVAQRCQCRQHRPRRSGRQHMLEAVARHRLARGLEHRVVRRSKSLARAYRPSRRPGAAPVRHRAGQAGQRQHHQHAAQLHHGPGQQVAAVRPPQHGQRPGQQHGACGAAPARALTRLAPARPSRPAKGSTMPRRSHSRPASCGLPVVQRRARRRAHQSRKEQAGRGARGGTSMPGATRPQHTSPHRPAMANGRLLSTSSAQGMPQSARWSANVCWCALAGSTGPNNASASSAAMPSSRPASARDRFWRSGWHRARGSRGVQRGSWALHPWVIDAAQCVQCALFFGQKVA